MSQPPDPRRTLDDITSQDHHDRAVQSLQPQAQTLPAQLANQTQLLITLLKLLPWLIVPWGFLGALGVYFGGIALVGQVYENQQLPTPLHALLLLLAAMSLALTWAGLPALPRACELISQLGSGSSTNSVKQMEQLRSTLERWLMAGQCAAVVAPLLSGLLIISLILSIGTDKLSVSPGDLPLQMAVSLVSSTPSVVITWLILSAIRRLMWAAVERTAHRPGPDVLPLAQPVNAWFILSIALLALMILQLLLLLLFSGFLLLSLLALPGLVIAGLVLAYFSNLALYSLCIAALQLSRRYVLTLAQLLDSPSPL